MTDRMSPLPIDQLYRLIMAEYKKKQSIFGISKAHFFNPKDHPAMRSKRFGQLMETPLGVAAGPHTQMAPNIIAAWLVGSRYIELKTVQTLDELEVSKPCIDMEDEGYNCEWSQELKLEQSFQEYLNAWILIHVLADKLQLRSSTKEVGTIFNMSVGYNMEGILKPNVQHFFAQMRDCRQEKEKAISSLCAVDPSIGKIFIPDQISNNITLSTMHGCPPDEIEKIAIYLLNDLRLHTTIKLNPTLNGPEKLRHILNEKLGFTTVVPDIAFEHDLKYSDGIKIIGNLQEIAKRLELQFSVKLTNTLESINNKQIFDSKNEMMYMSGRPLHVLAIRLANKLQKEFNGQLDITFCAGVDAFNVAQTIACNIRPITVCSDLLKPGGYERMSQYIKQISNRLKIYSASDLDDLVGKGKEIAEQALDNLGRYLANLNANEHYKKSTHPWKPIKTKRQLTPFDCIKAPCVETCPTNQAVPQYMHLTAQGKYKKALEVILDSNPFPNATGMACDHTCQEKCTRINYDKNLYIREIKRFLAGQNSCVIKPKRKLTTTIGVIGGGPSGLACAYFLALEGFQVELFEANSLVGGMLTYALPDYRAQKELVKKDIDRICSLGITIHENHPVTNAEQFEKLRAQFDYLYVATGAQKSKPLGIEGEDSENVIGFLDFLKLVNLKKIPVLPTNVVVIGGGNSAIDAARSAKRLLAPNGKITLVYRRTISQMPASREEIEDLLEENIPVMELTAPEKIICENNKIKQLECCKMKQGATLQKIAGSNFRLPVDYLIKAIGQETCSEIFSSAININERGLASSNHPKLLVGGDLFRGPSSIIAAINDGKQAAFNIMEQEGITPNKLKYKKRINLKDLIIKKARRIYPIPLSKTDSETRNNFAMILKPMNEQQAKLEAARCLQCDEICNVCVSLCPNRANIGYQIRPCAFELNDLTITNGQLSTGEKYPFELKQAHQVINLGDFCNECGNCATFCPTSGKPYRDKPKIYLSANGFELEQDNAYYLQKGKITFKNQNERWELTLIGRNKYRLATGFMNAHLNAKNLKFSRLEILGDGKLSMHHVATMSILVHNLSFLTH